MGIYNPSSIAGISLTVGSSLITGGTTGRVLYDNAGVLGEMTNTGTGTVNVLQTSPTLITPVLGAGTFTSLSSTAAPSAAYTFGGSSATTNLLVSTTATSNTNPEFAISAQIISGTGFSTDPAAFKVGITSVGSALPGSGSMWAANFSVGASALVGAVSVIGQELDLNIANRAYSGNGYPYATPLFIAGTSTPGNYGTAGIVMANNAGGGQAIFNYGMLFADNYSGSGNKLAVTATISDQTITPTIVHSNTSHTYGIDFSGGTFSTAAIKTPGFLLNGSGTITTGVWNGTAIANAYLANSSVTVNGTSISLGASGTVTAAASTLTGTTLASNVVTSSLTSVGTLGSLTVTGTATAGTVNSSGSTYNLNGVNALTQSGPYTILSTSNGRLAVQAGNASDPQTYYNNTNHVFRSADTLTTFATLAAGAYTLSVPLAYGGVTLTNAVTGTGAMVLSAAAALTGIVTNTSTGGQFYGATVRTGQTTVASLPAAATTGAGARAFVTDGSTTVILGLGLTVVGGGANKVPVYSDGTNWIVG